MPSMFSQLLVFMRRSSMVFRSVVRLGVSGIPKYRDAIDPNVFAKPTLALLTSVGTWLLNLGGHLKTGH